MKMEFDPLVAKAMKLVFGYKTQTNLWDDLEQEAEHDMLWDEVMAGLAERGVPFETFKRILDTHTAWLAEWLKTGAELSRQIDASQREFKRKYHHDA